MLFIINLIIVLLLLKNYKDKVIYRRNQNSKQYTSKETKIAMFS